MTADVFLCQCPMHKEQALVNKDAVTTDEAPRCWRCGRKLAERVTRPWQIRCNRCAAQNASEPAA